jgi:hypothetical protein
MMNEEYYYHNKFPIRSDFRPPAWLLRTCLMLMGFIALYFFIDVVVDNKLESLGLNPSIAAEEVGHAAVDVKTSLENRAAKAPGPRVEVKNPNRVQPQATPATVNNPRRFDDLKF